MSGDQSFFQTDNWKKKAEGYQNFIQRYHGKKLLILEFGVDWRNQMITVPFMKLAACEPDAFFC